MGKVLQGDCRKRIRDLEDDSIDLVVTSPPYAQQRKGLYEGIDEADYPAFTRDWMEALKPKLTANGSVLVIIRTHVKKGFISPYVLKTRLLLAESGWGEPEELIWHKPDGPPISSPIRPRRNFENILWFSLSRHPFVNLRACGKPSNRLGMYGGNRFKLFGYSDGMKEGVARITDVISCRVGANDKNIEHPAMFPVPLGRFLVESFCPEGGRVLDPFGGSGTVGVAAKNTGRDFVLIELDRGFVQLAKRRLK